MKSNNKGLIALSLILAPYLIYAHTTVLEEVVVKENKELKTNSINIDLSKIEQEQSTSFFDMFKNNASVDLGGGAINAKRLYLRGLESSTLNISLDGAKQGKNMFQHRGNELGINPDLLKSVDVRTSSNAALGSALGGSVVMKTKDAQDFVENNKNYGVILKAGYATNTESKSATATAYQVFNENLGAYLSIAGNNNENYKDGNNKRVLATGYKDRDYLFKLSLLNVNNNDLRVSVSQNENSGIFQWGKLGSDVGVNTNSSLLEKIVSTTTNYTLSHKYNPSSLVNLETNLNLAKIELNRKDKVQKYTNDTLGLKVQNHFDFETNYLKNRVSVGFDLQKEEGKGAYSPHRLDKDLTKYSDINSNNEALFMQNRSEIGNFGVNYGLRFDSYSLETGLGKAKDKAISPNIGIDYKFTENSLAYANYGKSSRMNGIIPFTWMLHTKKNTTYSSKLETEKATRYEIGYKYNKQNAFLNEDFFSFNANIFKTEIKDLIVSKARGGGTGEGGRTLVDISNSPEKFESKGFELQFAYSYDIFSSSLGYTQIDTNLSKQIGTSSTGVNESTILRRVGGYDSKKFVWNLELEPIDKVFVNYTLNSIAKNSSISRPGYTTHDINLKWQVAKPFTVFASVHNLTNKDYGKHTTIAKDGVYRYEMGRDFRVSLKYEF